MNNASVHKVYEFGDFRMDADQLMLYRLGDEIPLVPKAVETLLALIERRGRIVSKDELLEAVWPNTVVEESNLFLYLSLLKKTLGTQKDGSPYVETLLYVVKQWDRNKNESRSTSSASFAVPALRPVLQ